MWWLLYHSKLKLSKLNKKRFSKWRFSKCRISKYQNLKKEFQDDDSQKAPNLKMSNVQLFNVYTILQQCTVPVIVRFMLVDILCWVASASPRFPWFVPWCFHSMFCGICISCKFPHFIPPSYSVLQSHELISSEFSEASGFVQTWSLANWELIKLVL